MSSPKTPPEFDYYTISRVLGEGGMGLVYLAHDRRTGLPVAIKVMSKRVFDAKLQARFLKENRILSALNHRNIVRCFEITQSKTGTPSIVMEYVDGVDFRTFEGRPYPELLPLMIQALMGLTYLRSQNVLHRDLSSNNIFVTLENRKRLTKILDFGVAKLLQEQEADEEVKTQTGQFLGKFAFASPELFLSSQVDWRSDVFSLGVIFHRLLTKKPPISVSRTSNYFEWLMAHQAEHRCEVEAPAGVPPLPKDLADVVRRMLARKPEDRPQSYEEIIDVLHRVQLDVPAGLEPDPLSLETLPTPAAEPAGSSGDPRTSRTPSSPPVSRELLSAASAPQKPPEAPLAVEELQQKRWPDLEKTIEASSSRSPLASEPFSEPPSPSSPPEGVREAEKPLGGDPGPETAFSFRTAVTSAGTPPERPAPGADLVSEKTERFDDVLAKLRQETALHPPPPPASLPTPPPSPTPSPSASLTLPPSPSLSGPTPEARRPEAPVPDGTGERRAAAPSAPAGRRLFVYGEASRPPAPAPPRAAPPAAAPRTPAPPVEAGRRTRRWLGIGLIVAAIVTVFVIVLWALISLLRGDSPSSPPKSSLSVPNRVAAAATLPRLDSNVV